MVRELFNFRAEISTIIIITTVFLFLSLVSYTTKKKISQKGERNVDLCLDGVCNIGIDVI